MTLARTIVDVLQQQQAIIDWAVTNQSRAGYFAVLYRRMTLAVKAAMAKQHFEDNARMEQLIIHFANFYLSAWKAYTNKQNCCKAWQKVFEACDVNNLIVLQHLILGINTHINLDLAKAAEQTSPGDAIYDLQNDFDKINDIIAALSQDVQSSLEKVWWPLKALTSIANKRHEAVLNFSIDNARKASWANAIALTLVTGSNKTHHLQCMEEMVVALCNKIIHPGWFTGMLLKPVVWMEPKDVRKLIALLH